MARTYKPKREVVIAGDLAYIPLTQNQVAVVDAVDVPKVQAYTWTALRSNRTYYAYSVIAGRHRYLHRVLLDVDDPKQIVDHQDENGLNNRRSNLRITDKRGNAENRRDANRNNRTTGIKGICFHGGGYHVQLRRDGQFYSRFFSGDAAGLAAAKAYREQVLAEQPDE